MPVTLREGARVGSRERWRSGMDTAPLLRLRVALASFRHFLRGQDLAVILLICPDEEADVLRRFLVEMAVDLPCRVLPENDLLRGAPPPRDPRSGRIRGCYLQQVLKLAAAFHVTTRFMMTMDSDIVCVRPTAAGDLCPDGGAWTNCETGATYRDLYEPGFAHQELGIKEARMERARDLLGHTRSPRFQGIYYGETPCVWHTGSVRALCRHLEQRHHRPWMDVLARNDGWTEIALYYQYLEMTGDLERHHRLTHDAHVLDLPKSVWQPTVRYRRKRCYDRRHFVGDLDRRSDGHFVAIQSFLPPNAWLPGVPASSLQAFYRLLEQWLGIDGDTVTVGGQSYDGNRLSEQALALLGRLEVVDREIARLQRQLQIARTARDVHVQALVALIGGDGT